MTAERRAMVDEMRSPEVLKLLAQTQDSALVDVRTRAEWTFTGMPDLTEFGRRLLAVEWVSFPGMTPNARFYEEVAEQAGGSLPDRLFFICRSGGRSLAAARLVAAESEARGRAVHCTNVAEGFEGDLDHEGHRGRINGWKAHLLPWRQS